MAESTAPETGCFPFTRLPPDIQYNVIQSLCMHCSHHDDPMAMLYHSPESETEALMHLCLVSRDMRSLAQGILYHFPRVYSYTDFFRTLHARPELADSVKVQQWIYLDELYRYAYSREVVYNREDIWYLRSLAINLKLDDTDLVKYGYQYADYPLGHEDDVNGNGRHEFGIAFDNLATAITVALCRRLEFLSINLDDARDELRSLPEFKTPAKYQYLPGFARVTPDGLPLVRTLVLQNTLHHDPNSLGIDRLSFLWSLLPNVERLIFFRGSSEDHCYTDILVSEDEPRPEYSWKALPNIKDIRFLRYSRGIHGLPLSTIQRLVSGCKRLERFIFSPLQLVNKPFLPSELLQAISSSSSTLRHLTINCAIPEASEVDADYLIGSNLTQFAKLESLILDQAVFCHHHHDPNSTRGSVCLTDILPDSIQHLTINLHAQFAPLVDIIALGHAVSNGRFLTLSYMRVQISFEDTYWPEVDPPTSPYKYKRRVAPQEEHPDEINKPLLEPRRKLRKQITDAFVGTNVMVQLDFFRRRPYTHSLDNSQAPPEPPWWSDARLIGDEE